MNEQHFLNQILAQFDETAAEKVKDFEKQTNHDVKAVEYYLQARLLLELHLIAPGTFF
jgi:adenylosuccinate lyase